MEDMDPWAKEDIIFQKGEVRILEHWSVSWFFVIDEAVVGTYLNLNQTIWLR